jgi:NAD(P)-dependent dehydrogenase (short-subunit alcohol dehydrogenase family)
MASLVGKTALVTGGSRGIGRASALALGRAGAYVLVHYASEKEAAESVAAEIRAGGGRAEIIGVDLGAADGPHRLAREARRYVTDQLDVLVANAGVAKSGAIEDFTVEDFDRLYAINFTLSIQSLKRVAQPDDVGDVVTFLASPQSRWITGDTVRVDGGSKL